MLIYSLFFYFFSSIAIFASIMVTVSKNAVYSVFFLILVFISISILFIMIGAEFLGFIMLIVYVGAVAVLFLFVVMMLNVSEIKNKINEKKFIFKDKFVGIIVGLIILFEIVVAITGWKYRELFPTLLIEKINIDINNTYALGNVLYTDYIHLFQISGMILLVAMIGAITLTFNKRENIKRQNYFDQINRDKDTAVSLVDVENDVGVKIDD